MTANLAAAQPDRATRALAIVMVNWNRYTDTIECLESVLRSDLKVRIIVVDNGSGDNSIEHLGNWAEGNVAYMPSPGPLGRLTRPPVPKPADIRFVDADEARQTPLGDHAITVIASPNNLGFAGGNNLGIRHALNDPDVSYIWCLNNDTVVEPDATFALLAQLEATHKVGMCGTQLRYYHRPGHFQALNGHRFNLLSGQSRPIGKDTPVSRAFHPGNVARETDFVVGASLAVSREFVETVGFMDEDYFLYFEEMDWAIRNQRRFRTAFAHGAIVYHKEGGSIGSSSTKGQRSAMSEYYLIRSRIRFYRRNFPVLVPLQYLIGTGLAFRRLLRRQPAKAAAILRGMFGIARKETI